MDADDEMVCPGCGELVDVERPLGVEATVLEEPSYTVGTPVYTSAPGRVSITVGGVVVHRCGTA